MRGMRDSLSAGNVDGERLQGDKMALYQQDPIRQKEMPQLANGGRTDAPQSDCERNKRVLRGQGRCGKGASGEHNRGT